MSTEKISTERMSAERIKSNLLILSHQVGTEVKNIIGKTFTAVMDKLPKNADQFIIFDLGEVEFEEAKKISNEIYTLGHDIILDREAEVTVKRRKLNDSQLDNLVAKIIKVG